LIAAYNRGVGSHAWTSARGEYLIALREALLATGLDCSAFISDDGMSLDVEVRLKGRQIDVNSCAQLARPPSPGGLTPGFAARTWWIPNFNQCTR
jgi:hypothetical protein